MTFSLHQGGVIMSSHITHTIITYTPQPIYLTHAPWFSVVASVLQFLPTASCNASHHSPGDNYQSTGGRSDRTPGQAKMAAWNSFSYICTRALHSFWSFWSPLLAFIPMQSSIAQRTFQRSPRSILLIRSVYHIHFTSSITCHLRPRYLKQSTSTNGSPFSITCIEPPLHT